MVTTHQEALLEKMRILCLHGISKDAWNRYSKKGNWYNEVVECGFKYNLSDIQSAIHQLRKQETFIEARDKQARLYNQLLADGRNGFPAIRTGPKVGRLSLHWQEPSGLENHAQVQVG